MPWAQPGQRSHELPPLAARNCRAHTAMRATFCSISSISLLSRTCMPETVCSMKKRENIERLRLLYGWAACRLTTSWTCTHAHPSSHDKVNVRGDAHPAVKPGKVLQVNASVGKTSRRREPRITAKDATSTARHTSLQTCTTMCGFQLKEILYKCTDLSALRMAIHKYNMLTGYHARPNIALGFSHLVI
jgi:hypothetical protein